MGMIDDNAPLRLLRKVWNDPTELAQELYAMFSARGPTEVQGPLTIRAPEGVDPIRVVREPVESSGPGSGPRTSFTFGAPGRARPIAPPDSARGPASPATAPAAPARRAPAPGRPEEPRAPRPATAEEAARAKAAPPRKAEEPDRGGRGEPLNLEAILHRHPHPPIFFDRARARWPALDEQFLWKQAKTYWPGGAGGGTTTYVARCEDGSGRDYTMTLLPNGTENDDGDRVQVNCPTLDLREVIPQGTLVTPVFKFNDRDGKVYYQGFPPVWLVGSTEPPPVVPGGTP